MIPDSWTRGMRNEHRFHIHDNDCEVIFVNGQPYSAHGWQNSVRMPDKGEVVVRIPFEDYPGRFVYHSHIMFHGDGGMMGVVKVVE